MESGGTSSASASGKLAVSFIIPQKRVNTSRREEAKWQAMLTKVDRAEVCPGLPFFSAWVCCHGCGMPLFTIPAPSCFCQSGFKSATWLMHSVLAAALLRFSFQSDTRLHRTIDAFIKAGLNILAVTVSTMFITARRGWGGWGYHRTVLYSSIWRYCCLWLLNSVETLPFITYSIGWPDVRIRAWQSDFELYCPPSGRIPCWRRFISIFKANGWELHQKNLTGIKKKAILATSLERQLGCRLHNLYRTFWSPWVF